MTILVLSLIFIIIMLAVRVPVAFAFGIASIGLMFAYGLGFGWVMISTFSLLTSFPLLAIPLYVFLGILMEHSGLVIRIIDFVDVLVGNVKGGLGYVVVLATGIFGAISGSAGASLVTFGTIVFPKMKARGYNEGYAVALIASSAMLDLFIPPSMDMIMFGYMARLNIAACFLATVGGGILLIIFYLAINWYFTRNMNIPQAPKLGFKPWAKRVANEGRRAFVVVVVLPVIILGGIYGGVFTPTEAAGVAVVVVLILAGLFYRTLGLKGLRKAMIEATYLTGMIMAVLFFIFIAGRVMLWMNVVQTMVSFLTSISGNIYVHLLLINLMLFAMDTVLDDNSACIIAGILLVPVGLQVGINPYHLAGIVMANLGLGLLTPPVAPLLYLASGVTGVPLKVYFKYSIYFMLFANLPVLILVTFIPEISTYLPNLLYGTGLGTW
jgi:tripartite ATP-independent transporter DctM subunit